MLEYKSWYTSIDAYSSEYKRSGTSVVTNRVSAVERHSNALLYSWASLRWAQLIRKSSLMSATLCSTFSVARLTLSSCPTRARPIEQTTQLSAYKLNQFSKEHGSLKRHLICAYLSNQHSQKSEWHSMNVPMAPPKRAAYGRDASKFLCGGGERERREREGENGKRLESERSLCFCQLRGKTPR